MRLAIRIGTGLVALGMAGSVAACSSSGTPSGSTTSSIASAASSAVSSASSFASSAASSVSSEASSAVSSATASTGSTGSTANVSITNITGGNTTITFDQNYLTALKTLNLTPTATGQATLSGSTATFPVTGGTLSLAGTMPSGTIKHAGGIQLAAGPAKILLNNFQIDPSAKKLYGDISVNGQTAATHVDLFDLDLSSAQTQATSGMATISGVKLTLSNEAATALNQALHSTAIQGNFPVGTATVTVKGS